MRVFINSSPFSSDRAARLVLCGRSHLLAGSAAAARLTLPRFPTFFDGDACDEESRERIGPPEAEERVCAEASEQRGREVRAEHVLPTFAPGRRGAESLSDVRFRDGEWWHGQECDDCEPDPDPTRFRRIHDEERPECLEGDVGGQQVEARTDELLGAPLRTLRGSAGSGEAPQKDDPRHGLNERIRSEADESYRTSDEPGADGYGGLHAVPTDPKPCEEFGSSDESRPLGRLQRLAGPELNRLAAQERAPAFSTTS